MIKLFLVFSFLLLQSYGEVAPKSYKNVRLDFRGMATRFPYYNLRVFPAPHKQGYDDSSSSSFKKYRVKSSMLEKLYQRDLRNYYPDRVYPFDSFQYYSWQPKLGSLHILSIMDLIEDKYGSSIDCLIYDSTGKKINEFALSSATGDGGYYIDTSGYFINDSTYKRICYYSDPTTDTTKYQFVTILRSGELRKTKPKLVSYHHSSLWGQ